jgi:sugar phosphate isomerase/epimerase
MTAPPFPALRGRFPFKLAAPSFVVPGSYIANAELLAGSVDAIELLFFESGPNSTLPDRAELDALRRLGSSSDLDYVLHLPIDLRLGALDFAERADSLGRLLRVWELGQPLEPELAVLHLEPGPLSNEDQSSWIERVEPAVEALVQAGCARQRLCLETLDFGVEPLAELARRSAAQLALDLGHAVRDGLPALELLRRHRALVRLLHLHGAAPGRDHLPLEVLGSDWLRELAAVLREPTFSGVLCVEVFEAAALLSSLQAWEAAWHDRGKRHLS